MIKHSEIQKRLAEEIQLCGKSQTEIARKIGISQPTISDYKNCRRLPALDTFVNLCKVLDVDTNYILCLDETDK